MSTDTTTVTSDVRVCDGCGQPFGQDDDRRYKECAVCRGAPPKTEPSPDPDLPMAGVEAMRLDLKPGEIPEVPATDFYWCGVTDDCPRSYLTLGGICFPRTIGRVITDPATGMQECRNNVDDGVVNRLTEANVNLILEHAKHKVIRNHRKRTHKMNSSSGESLTERVSWFGTLLSTKGRKDRAFIRQAGDRSAGCFVYMIKVRHKNDRPMENPPTLVARNW